LIDDRAPAFETINKTWKLSYSPALFLSLTKVAERCWDALGITGFDRFWDMSITNLAALAMRIDDGALKREILIEINEIVTQHRTAQAVGDLTFSLAYVELSSMLENISEKFVLDAAFLGKELPMFLVPKTLTPEELEEMDSGRRRGHPKKPPIKKPPPRKPPLRKGAKEAEDASRTATPTESRSEYAPELRQMMTATVLEELKKRITAFEKLAGESLGVGDGVTKGDGIGKLDSDLEPEVDDGL
jgi:hypothetical protein